MALTVLSLSMDDEDLLHRKRQGFWLRMAREAKGVNQEGAAKLVGLSTKSAISDYENGTTAVPQKRLIRLAKEYGWDIEIFMKPDLTAEEQALDRMARLARSALHVADRVTAEEAAAASHAGDETPAAQPRTRSA